MMLQEVRIGRKKQQDVQSSHAKPGLLFVIGSSRSRAPSDIHAGAAIRFEDWSIQETAPLAEPSHTCIRMEPEQERCYSLQQLCLTYQSPNA